MLDLSISLVVYNPNFEDLEKLFHSISLKKDVSFEFLVWDNSPPKNEVKSLKFPIDYKLGTSNLGNGTGHNRNFERSRPAKYFLVINPDIYFDDPFFIKKIVDRMNTSPSIGLSSVRLLNQDGTTQDMHRLLPSLGDIAKRFVFQKLKIYKPETHKYTLMHIDKTKDFICQNIGGSFMAELFQARGYNFKVLIAGEGELKGSLLETIKNKGLQDRATLHGHVTDISAFMNSIDHFVFPSLFEGSANRLIEALDYEKPIVAFDVSSNPEIIQHRVNGLLAKAFESEDLTKCVEELRRQYVEAGEKVVREKFDNLGIIEELKRIC